MGQTCCGNNGDTPELNLLDKDTHGQKAGGQDQGITAGDGNNMVKAATILQSHFRGLVTRRAIKAQYGFEATTAGMGRDGQTYSQSDA